MSQLEETLALQLRATLTGGLARLRLVREYRFHDAGEGEKQRQWRFDFAFPDIKVAIECEGLGRVGKRGGVGRHQSFSGFTQDCEKYNMACFQGWKVLRFTRVMIDKGEAIKFILKLLGE